MNNVTEQRWKSLGSGYIGILYFSNTDLLANLKTNEKKQFSEQREAKMETVLMYKQETPWKSNCAAALKVNPISSALDMTKNVPSSA